MMVFMKLFLLSHNLLPHHVERFQQLIGKLKVEKALFISAAAVPYGLESKPEWLVESLEMVKQFANKVDETSLEDGSNIPEDLSQYEFIFVSGGNSFYLAYRLAETGFDKKIKQYIENGGIYSGSSAGAIILMDDIEAFAPADHPNEAPKRRPGLSIINFALIPHVDHEKYAPIMKDISKVYKSNGYEIVALKDDQVLVVEEGTKEII